MEKNGGEKMFSKDISDHDDVDKQHQFNGSETIMDHSDESNSRNLSAISKPRETQHFSHDDAANSDLHLTTSSSDKSILQDQSYLQLGFNPEIQVSIEVLHNKATANVVSTTKSFHDTPSTLTTVTPYITTSDYTSKSNFVFFKK